MELVMNDWMDVLGLSLPLLMMDNVCWANFARAERFIWFDCLLELLLFGLVELFLRLELVLWDLLNWFEWEGRVLILNSKIPEISDEENIYLHAENKTAVETWAPTLYRLQSL